MYAGKFLKVNFTFPQTHPEILIERSCSNNIYPCSNYWWAILWKDQAKQLCKLIQWGGKKILDIHICEWKQKWSWRSLKRTKTVSKSSALSEWAVLHQKCAKNIGNFRLYPKSWNFQIEQSCGSNGEETWKNHQIFKVESAWNCQYILFSNICPVWTVAVFLFIGTKRYYSMRGWSGLDRNLPTP